MFNVTLKANSLYKLVLLNQKEMNYKKYNKTDKPLVHAIRTLDRLNVIYKKDRKKGRALMREYPNSFLQHRKIFKKRVPIISNDVYEYVLIMSISKQIDKEPTKKSITEAFMELNKRASNFVITSLSIDMDELLLFMTLDSALTMLEETIGGWLIEISLVVDEELMENEKRRFRRFIKTMNEKHKGNKKNISIF